MPCNTCSHWVLKRRRLYADGTEKVYFWVSGGNGLCTRLQRETGPQFFCADFTDDATFDHVETENVSSEPWQNWKMGKCPDCDGRGSGLGEIASSCWRCAGTGNVRFYDDGHVGDERTRRHPKEPAPQPIVPETLKPIPKPNVL